MHELRVARARFFAAVLKPGVGLHRNLGAPQLAELAGPNFGFAVSLTVAGVEAGILDPRQTRVRGDEYDHSARMLDDPFRRNFTQFVDSVDASIRAAGPPGLFDA